jgi:hypothetical protein
MYEARSSHCVAHCAGAGRPLPQIFHEQAADGVRVWIVMGKERLELPTRWKSLAEGEDRLCRQVLKRMQATVPL